MKKFVTTLSLVLSIFLFAGVTRAANDGSPWDQIWATISSIQENILSLQNQIDTIELTPGPEGPQGPIGETGPQGPQGIQGEEGPPGPALTGFNKDLVYVVESVFTPVLAGGPATFVSVRCNDNNDPVLSGGYFVSQGASGRTEVVANAGRPTDSTAGWVVGAITDATNNISPGQIKVEAYCLRVD